MDLSAARSGLVPTRRAAVELHAALGATALVVLVLQSLAVSQRQAWVVLEVPVAGFGLWLAWRRQELLSLRLVLVICLAFHVASILLFRHLGYTGDQDTNDVYLPQGHRLLDGHYPPSEYPVGAVLLFALEAAINPNPPQVANALLMLPFLVACVWGIWALRTRSSPWFATVVAFWPLAEYYWEFRYDATAAALLVVGLLLAYRGRFVWSGLALGVGACFKWTPGLVAVVLAAWLLAGRRLEATWRLLGAFVGVSLLLYVPFLLTWPAHDVLASFRVQSGRVLTQESLWFWPAWALGKAKPTVAFWDPAGAPHWMDVLVTVVQVVLLAGIVAAAARHPASRDRAVALAALAPVVFLVTNRVFSVQFVIVLAVGWLVAASLITVDRREQLLVGVGVVVAVACNAFMAPYGGLAGAHGWPAFAFLGWIVTVALTGLLTWRAALSGY